MINTVTTSTEVHIISPVYFLLFLVLMGFIYHLIRNKEYKDTLLASIIIGFIFGLLFNTSFDLLKTVTGDLMFILLVIIGGFVAVSVKKLLKDSIIKESYKTPETPQNVAKIWWDKLNPKVQTIIIIGACLLCLVLITSTFALLNPVEDQFPVGDHVQLKLDPSLSSEIKLADINDKEGTILLISNNTTEYTLKGSSESDATIKITASELGIYNQIAQLDSNNNFTYKLNIPTNVSLTEITVEATKPGKGKSILTLTLKR